MHARTDTPSVYWPGRFFIVWTGQQLSLFGSSLAQFALVWWVTKTTGSAAVLTTSAAMALLPSVLLGPFIGTLVDRIDRRKMLIAADGFVALVAVWVVYLFWSGSIQVWHIYIILLARGVGGRFHHAAMLSTTPLMVPKHQLQRVSGYSQTVSGMVDILSPALGALMIAVMPLYGVMAVDVLTAAFAIGPLLFLRLPNPPRAVSTTHDQSARGAIMRDTRAGLRYLVEQRGLGILWGLAMALNFLCGPAFFLTPILVMKVYSGGVEELGLAHVLLGIGAVLGGVILSLWPGFKRRGRPWRVATLLGAVIGVGFGFIIVAFAPQNSFGVALGGLFLVAMISTISGGLFPVMIQTIVPPEMQGRIFSIFSTLTSAELTLGMIAAGPLADWLGVRAIYFAGGLSQVLIGAAGFTIPALVGVEEELQPAAA